MTQNHRADQNVTCPGCGDVFTRAGNYVAHLEDGKCKSITKKDFQGSIQQKHVVNEIMKNPEEFIQGLRMNKTLTPTSDKPGLIVDGSETQETEEGGVPLLDQEDEAQKGGYKPLQAEVNLIDMNIPYTRSNVETWPRLPGQQPSQLTSSMHSLSLNSRTPSINGSEVSASEYASEITSRRGGTKVYTESFPSLNSPRIPASLNGDDDTASVATSTVGSSTNRPMAWTTAKTSQALFKDAKPTPPAGDWTAVWNYRQQEAAANDSTNLFRSRLWDPDSKEYDVELFFNSMIEKYRCPFPECDGTYYDEPSDIEGHLRVTHLKTSYRCPLCLKIFRSANALVSHSEAGGKCKVKKSSMYDKLLDEISGGYLKAQHLIEPKVYKPGDALVKAGQRVDGVMDTRFTAKLPGEK